VLVYSCRLNEQTQQLVFDRLVQGTLFSLVNGSCTVPLDFKLKSHRTEEVVQSSFNLVKNWAYGRDLKGAGGFDLGVIKYHCSC